MQHGIWHIAGNQQANEKSYRIRLVTHEPAIQQHKGILKSLKEESYTFILSSDLKSGNQKAKNNVMYHLL